MADPAALSPFQPLAQMFGGQQGVTPGLGSAGNAVGGGINNMISALMKSTQGTSPPAPDSTGTYEGNIWTAANPYDPSTGTFGTPASSSGMPPPRTGGAPPALPSGPPPGNPFVSGARPIPFMSPTGAPSPGQMPSNPFAGGAPSTPFLNGSALFGRLPMVAGSPFGMSAQRPNPISQMQL